jgi:hypothetical protein
MTLQEELVKKALIAPVVILALIAAVAPLAAHHAWPVTYEQLVTVRGTVLDFTWTNPHPMISLEVKNEAGQIEKWSIGGPAINRMTPNGWSPTAVKPGDVITGVGYQFSDGQKIIRLERVTLPDGKVLRVYARN